ncbi:MAG: hypothetical protein RR162_00170 [Oscillospiraceae bacterium]
MDDLLARVETTIVDTEEEHSPKCEHNGKIVSTGKMYVDKYTILFDDKVISGYLIDEVDEEISLDDVTDIAKSKGYNNHGVLTVILETMRGGTIYQYGSYGDYWVKHGRTNGLA